MPVDESLTNAEIEKRTIRIAVAHKHDRSGRRMYEARYDWKIYAEFGRTRAEALGKLLLGTPVPGYLEIRISEE